MLDSNSSLVVLDVISEPKLTKAFNPTFLSRNIKSRDDEITDVEVRVSVGLHKRVTFEVGVAVNRYFETLHILSNKTLKKHFKFKNTREHFVKFEITYNIKHLMFFGIKCVCY